MQRSFDRAMRPLRATACALLLGAAALSASAQTSPPPSPSPPPAAPPVWDKPVRGFVSGGLSTGGDRLATVEWSNGDTTDIRAGGLVEVRAGIEAQLGDSPFSLAGSIGWFSHRAGGRNGSVTFERFPLELMGRWRLADEFRLGVGVRRTGDARLRGRGAASNVGTTTFDGKVGGVVEGEWLFARRYGLAVRAVSEDYRAPNGEKADGSHVGVRFSFYF